MLRLNHHHLATVLLAFVCYAGLQLQAAETTKTVKVFVLAGQSNMEGKASNELIDHQAEDPKTKDFYQHLRKDGKWIVRDDVFINYLERKGPLTVGYGSPNKTGSELEFGTMLGDHYEEPVLLIKAAWGGHSLFKLFRSPSAGMPSEQTLQKELEQAQKKVQSNNEKKKRSDPLPTIDDIKSGYGSSYRNMLAEVNKVRENYKTLFPELKDCQFEIAGFYWFQGFNDLFGDQDDPKSSQNEYASNMKHFINDVRKDLQVPNLPFVIAAIGNNGSAEANPAMTTIREAQLSMGELPEFKGNVFAFRTDLLVDKDAEALYPKWKENFEQWKLTGSDRAYHYFGSGIWYTRIGHAAGAGMLELLKNRK